MKIDLVQDPCILLTDQPTNVMHVMLINLKIKLK